MTKHERLCIVQKIGEMMDSAEQLDVNGDEPGNGNTIHVNSENNRIVAARDYIEINIHMADRKSEEVECDQSSGQVSHEELLRQIRSLVSSAIRTIPQEAA